MYYRDASGNIERLAVGSGAQCLLGGAIPAWGTCTGDGTGTNYWQLTGAVLSPGNLTTDFTLGGTSTASAKFAVLGVNTNTPTASVSSQNAQGYALYLDPANGALQTLRNQTLTLGGGSTGNIVLSPLNNSGRVGINTSTPLATLDVAGNIVLNNGGTIDTRAAGTLGIGTTTQTGLTVGRTGTATTINGNSSSAIDFGNFDVATSGNITVAAAQGLDTNAAGVLNLGNTTATTVSIGGTAATALNLGAGGALARAISIGTGTGIDTINIGTGATGADVINIGSANAGNVTIRSNAVLNLTGAANSIIDYPNFDVATSGNITVAAAQGLDTNAAGVLNLGNTTATTVSIGGTAATALNLGAGGALARAISIGTGTGIDTINIGTGATGADVITIGNSASNLSLTDNNWTISNTGIADFDGLTISSGSHNNCSALTTDGTGAVGCNTQTLSLGTNYWTSADTKSVTLLNNTMDLLVGGPATTSAKFAVLNMTGAGSPTASVSAQSGTYLPALVLNSSGAIQSVRNNTLTIGGNTTGNIVLSPLNSIAGSKILPGADNLVSLGASPSGRFKDLFLGPGSLHVICTTGDGCGQNLDYALGVDTSTNEFYIGINGRTGALNKRLRLSEAGNITFGGNIVPDTDLTYNVGSVTNRLNNVYAYTYNALGNSTPGVLNLGRSDTTDTAEITGYVNFRGNWAGSQFTQAGIYGYAMDTFGAAARGMGMSFRTTSIGSTTVTERWDLQAAGHWVPYADSTYDIGTSSLRPANIYSDALNINAAFTANGTTGTTSDCLKGGSPAAWGSCGTGNTDWDILNGALSPEQADTADFLLGAKATSSANFAVIGINGTAIPIASVSAQNAGGQALSLSGDGSIQTTRNNTLTIGGSSTGNIVLSPNNGTNGLISLNAPTINSNATTLALFGTPTTINFGASVGSGGINFAGGSGFTGCTIVGDSGNFNCSGTASFAGTGTALTLSGASTTALSISGGATTGINLSNIAAGGTAINISDTDVTTDINLQNGETIDNNTNNTINLGFQAANGILNLTSATSANITNSAGPLFLNGVTYVGVGANGTNNNNATGADDLFVEGDLEVDDAFYVGGSGAFTVNVSGAVTASTGLTLTSGAITLGGVTGSGLCVRGGATATWGTCDPGGSLWTTSADGKAMVQGNTTQDLLLGGIATSSAKFAFNATTGNVKQKSNGANYIAGGDVTGSTGSGTGNLAFSKIALNGNYAYLVSNGSSTTCSSTPGSAIGCEFQVWDISDAENPVYVAGGDSSGLTNAGTSDIGMNDIKIKGNYVFIAKSYDYSTCSSTPGSASDCEIQVWDISNPENPLYISGADSTGLTNTDGGTDDGIDHIEISGNFMYAISRGQWGSGCISEPGSAGDCQIQGWDISNPYSLKFIWGADAEGDVGSGTAIAFYDDLVYHNGFLYITTYGNADPCSSTPGSAIGCELVIFDVTDPYNPFYTAGVDVSGTTGSGTGDSQNFTSVDFKGNYLFVTSTAYFTACSGSAGSAIGCEIKVFDVSDPSSPSYIAGVDSAGTVNSGTLGEAQIAIKIIGNYLYVGGYGDSITCSNIAGTAGADDCEMKMFDITDPFSPSYIAGMDISGSINSGNASSHHNDFQIRGKYLFALPNNSATTCSSTPGSAVGCELQIWDLAGIEATSVLAHSLEAGQVWVNNSAEIGKDLFVGGALTVGDNGIFSQGDVTVQGDGIFNNKVGIGTSSATALLDIRKTLGYSYTESAASSSFTGGGTAQSWNADDQIWSYTLPFTFPYYDKLVTDIQITPNGNIFMCPSCGVTAYSLGSNYPMIGPLNGDWITNGSGQSGEDIYISTTANSVTITWKAEKLGSPTDILNFSVTLTDTGNITFKYGSGNTNVWSGIGISKGDGSTYDTSANSGLQNQTNANDVIYTANGESLFTVAPTSSTSALFEVDVLGNVGINTKIKLGGDLGSSGECLISGGSVGSVDWGVCLSEQSLENNGPLYKGGADISGSTNSGTSQSQTNKVVTSGKYAYVVKMGDPTACSQTSGSAIGCELQVYDISDPSAPAYIGGADVSGNTNSGTGDEDLLDVAVSGNYVYVSSWATYATCSNTVGSGEGCELKVFDVSNPSEPTYIGSGDTGGTTNSGTWGTGITNITIKGNRLYAGTDSNWGSTACGQIPGWAVACELQIWDISNPSAPAYLGGTDASGLNTGSDQASFTDIKVFGDYAYVTQGLNSTACSATPGSAIGCELKVFNISDPKNITYLGGANSTGSTNSGTGGTSYFRLDVSGKYAYITSYADPTACSQTPGSAIGCELQVYDISDPSAPTYVGGADSSGSTNSGTSQTISFINPKVMGKYVYITGGYDSTDCSQIPGSAIGCEIQVYDISDPSAPAYIGGADGAGLTNSGTGGGSTINGISISGKYAYTVKTGGTTACSQTPGSAVGCEFQVWDITGIEATSVIAHSLEAGQVTVVNSVEIGEDLFVGGALTVGDNGIYSQGTISAGTISAGGLHVIGGVTGDLSFTSPTLTEKGIIRHGVEATYLDMASSVYVLGKYAYVVSSLSSSLTVIDISNPTSPTQVGVIRDGVGATNFTGPRDVYVSGKYAYAVTSGSNSFTVIDISNPLAPKQLGTIVDGVGATELDGAWSVYVSGKYAYVASIDDSSVTVIDISNPSSPVQVGTIKDGVGATQLNSAHAVYVSGKYAYVASQGDSSLTVIDISNPSSPKEIGTIIDNSVGGTGTQLLNAQGVYVSGKYAYVASASDNSLSVIDISNPSLPKEIGTLVSARLNGAEDVYVSGKYAYVASSISDSLTVIDISNPASPLEINYIIDSSQGGVATDLNAASSLYVSGKYAYVTSRYNGALTVIDISGIDAPVANIGNLASSNITVSENVNIGNDLYVANSVNIGFGGLMSNGAFSFSSASGSGNLIMGAPTGKALLTLDQLGNQDIFTASASGQTKFTVKSDGNVVQSNNGPIYVGGADSTGSTNSGSGAISHYVVKVIGKYAFVGSNNDYTACSGTPGSGIGCEFKVYDISDPSAPVYIAGVDASGSTNSGTDAAAVISISIFSNYAFVGTTGNAGTCSATPGSAIGCELKVIDISDPSAPVYIAGVDVSGSTNSGAGNEWIQDIRIAGQYVFFAQTGDSGTCSATPGSAIGCELKVIDISDPILPKYVGGADYTGYTNSGNFGANFNSIFISDGYIYITKVGDANTCSATPGSATGCELMVFDISDPILPKYVGGADASGSTNSGTESDTMWDVSVSGEYAYIAKLGNVTACSQTPGSAIGCELQAYDISNPRAPTYVGGADSSGSTNSGASAVSAKTAYVLGKYLYAGYEPDGSTCSSVSGSALGCEIKIYDISDSSAPVYQSGADESGYTNSGTSGNGTYDLYVNGRYLYHINGGTSLTCSATPGSASGCEFKVWDLIGIEATSVVAHSLEAGQVKVNNSAEIGENLFVNGALSVGSGGIYSQGPITADQFNINNASVSGQLIQKINGVYYKGGGDASGSTNSGIGSGNFASTAISGKYTYITKGGNSTACSQTAGSAIGCELQVWDISNPSAPAYVGGGDASGSTNSGIGSSSFDYIIVSGNYAYIAKAGSSTACSQTAGSAIGCELQVWDISNPSAPAYVGGGDASGSTNSGTTLAGNMAISISGNYAYLTKGANANGCSQTAGSAQGCELQVWDISNPSAPAYVGGGDASGSTNSGTGAATTYISSTSITGKYAYVVKANDSTACSQTAGSAIGCELMVWDISIPSAPAYVGGGDASGSTNSGTGSSWFYNLSISGNYVYTAKTNDSTACSQTAGSAIGCELMVWDISIPSAPAYVGGGDASGSTNSGTGNIRITSISISGNYVYTAKTNDSTACSQTAGSAIGCELMVWDISIPSAPAYIGGGDASGSINSGTGNIEINSISISGNYVYVSKLQSSTACSQTAGSAIGCELMVWNIPGFEATSVLAHSLEAGILSIVSNANVGNNLNVLGGLSVGGSIQSTYGIGVYGKRGGIDGRNAIAAFGNRGSSYSDVLSLEQSGEAGGTGSDFIEFYTNAGKIGDIDSNGAGVVAYNAFTGSHYAWTTETDLEYGLLMSLTGDNIDTLEGVEDTEPIYGVTKSTVENDPKILGAYFGHQGDINGIENVHSVAAVGNADVWIVDTGENVTRGDAIISSSTSGHGMKDPESDSISYVIGRAGEDIDWNNVTEEIDGVKHKKITVLMDFYAKFNDPDAKLANIDELNINPDNTVSSPSGSLITRVGSFAEAAIGKIRAGLIEARKIRTDELEVTSENVSINGMSLAEYITGIASNQESGITNQEIESLIEEKLLTYGSFTVETSSTSAQILSALVAQAEGYTGDKSLLTTDVLLAGFEIITPKLTAEK